MIAIIAEATSSTPVAIVSAHTTSRAEHAVRLSAAHGAAEHGLQADIVGAGRELHDIAVLREVRRVVHAVERNTEASLSVIAQRIVASLVHQSDSRGGIIIVDGHELHVLVGHTTSKVIAGTTAKDLISRIEGAIY